MGRRKLPSLPPQRTEKASEGIPPPIYLTSSAPLYPTESERSAAAQEQSAFTRTKVRANSYTDLTRPSSANSLLSNADSHSTIDPAIIPGATITGVKPRIRQTSSAVTGGRPAALLTQPTNYKMPTTLARVLLKKELKEALEKRKESLEACEIEANQRQYVVRRMLVSGLLPESRPAEIDDIPNVIPCLLPIELISGANVIPTTSNASDVNNRYSSEKSCYTEPASSTSKTQNIAISTDKSTPLLLRAKSIGVQVDNLEGSSGLSSPVSMHNFSLSQKDRIHCSTYNTASTPAITKYVSTETQTENSSGHDKRRNKAGTFSSTKKKGGKKISSSDTNLLETTAKYFAEYDRQLREHGRLMRHRFTFADDDPIKRETKKQRLMDELAKRKEKMSSMIDLNTATDFPPDHGVSDYSSTVPHYGSLPRLDYSSNVRPLRYRDSYNYYNSLPRNYERYYDMYDYNCPDYNYMQPSPASGMRPDLLTRSLNDLRLDPEESIIDPRMRSSAAHSLDYLGHSAYPYRDSRYSLPLRRPYPYSKRYASDDINAQNLRYNDMEPGSKPDIISQYANFLSNQFRSDQVEHSLREHHIAAPLCLSTSSTNIPSSSRYTGPMSDPYPPYRGCTQQRIPPYGNSLYKPYDPGYQQEPALPSSPTYGQRMYEKNASYGPYGNRPGAERFSAAFPSTLESHDYMTEVQPNAYMNTLEYGSDPLYSRELSQVYSRNEANYGSKPLQTATDYGNFYRNQHPQATASIDPYGGYVNEKYPGPSTQEAYRYPYNVTSPNYSSFPQTQQVIGNSDIAGPSFSNATNRYNRGNMYNIPQTSYGLSQNNNSKRYGRSWPLSNYYDESYPQEDALSRVYATASGQYRQPPSQRLGNMNLSDFSCI
uniref:CUPID domain-containing protein n=1 Tax=Syphacia muris TaxID=451379 RepID=A0A0N5AA03_9BILA